MSNLTAHVDSDLAQIVAQQTESARAAVTAVEPQTWLFAERARFAETGACDPYAEQILRLVNLLPEPALV